MGKEVVRTECKSQAKAGLWTELTVVWILNDEENHKSLRWGLV